MKLYISYTLDNPIMDTQSSVTIDLIGVNKSGKTVTYGLTCLWDSRYPNTMINMEIINLYKEKLILNKL